MEFSYPKGSEWRKWDLQTQTILDDRYTELNSYAHDIKTADAKRWADYTARVGGEANALRYDSKAYFNDSALPTKERCTNYVRNYIAFVETFCPDLACVGITDHNYWHDELLDTFVHYAATATLKVIPGVEVNCVGIHLLLYFPHPPYERPTYSDGIRTFLTKIDIDNPKKNGVLTVTSFNIKDLIDVVDAQDGLLIFPHCNSDNGLFQERGRTDRTHLADIFNYQRCNLLQFRNQDSALALQGYIRSNAAFTSAFSTHISSDARALREYGSADKDGNYLWVKADPTFEGLRQILYEPDERIAIGPQRPGGKKAYFIIDKTRFIDNRAAQEFASEAIEINSNLTAIIGGKSTGKSLLLYYIAKTIDPIETAEKIAAVTGSRGYDLDSDPDFNFEVTWADGQVSLLKGAPGVSTGAVRSRKILYLPQKYLNSLSETNVRSREALNAFVLSVLLQDPAIRDLHDRSTQTIRALKRSIEAELGQLFVDVDDIRAAEEDLREAGDEEGIRRYIASLEQEIGAITARSGLDNEEIARYEQLVDREQAISAEIANLEADDQSIDTLRSTLHSQLAGLEAVAMDAVAYVRDQETKAALVLEVARVTGIQSRVNEAADRLRLMIKTKLEHQTAAFSEIQAALVPLLDKVQLQTELKAKAHALTLEQQKLHEVVIRAAALATKRESYTRRVKAVQDAYAGEFAEYDTLRNALKAFESKFGDITVGVYVGFDETTFNESVIKEYVNRIDLRRLTGGDWNDEYMYRYDPTKHLAAMETIVRAMLDGKVATIRGRTVKEAVAKLTANYFFMGFRIHYKKDSLDRMSPGKKGMVLLQLLINLSNEEWPILLDQPEDDLDNRSVFDDLVTFLRVKKRQRQLLIVTHNPNLVVGADAEQVIVANQTAQETGRDNRQHRFEYVSGGLENAFEKPVDVEPAILFRKGIQQHVCEILEGGVRAFQKREQKYDLPDA